MNVSAPPKKLANVFTGYIGALICSILFLYFLQLSPQVLEKKSLSFQFLWINSLNIHFSFLLDGLSLLFSLLITGIGALIMLYSSVYFKDYTQGVRIQLVLICFMFSMLGLVLSNDIIQLFIFWELTTITSFILIGTKYWEESARKFAIQAFLVTGSGGLAFLVGLLLLAQEIGSFDISILLQADIKESNLYIPIFLLLILGSFSKSAQFPFHFWLPNAMAAPTPISAYLHSATMVKAGIYFLARFYPLLADTAWWFWFLTISGGITAIWSSILAYRQQDLKLMMAYTTLMALGTITFLLGFGNAMILTTAMAFLLVHALYKATLFMVVGIIEKATGTRTWNSLGMLHKTMPITAISTALAALSMAGFAPTFGFIAKELLYQQLWNNDSTRYWSLSIFWTASTLIAGIAFFTLYKPFWSKANKIYRVKTVSNTMIVPPLILAVTGLGISFIPSIMQPFYISLSLSMRSITQIDFGLWHGINAAFLLSVATIIFGLLLSASLPTLNHLLNKYIKNKGLSCESIYDNSIIGFVKIATLLLNLFQSGKQRFYILIIFISLGIICLTTFLAHDLSALMDIEQLQSDIQQITFYQAGLVGLMALSLILTLVSHSRSLAICSLGVLGICMALIFTLYSAPDVAMTQFMVEILVVILLSMLLKRLPKFTGKSHGSRLGRLRDAFIAIIVGSMVSWILLIVSQYPLNQSLNHFYELNSYTKAHGKNIVNVILVDFRAIDTLGEIVVVGLAALGCWLLICFKEIKKDNIK